jgi:hypothetical protein
VGELRAGYSIPSDDWREAARAEARRQEAWERAQLYKKSQEEGRDGDKPQPWSKYDGKRGSTGDKKKATTTQGTKIRLLTDGQVKGKAIVRGMTTGSAEKLNRIAQGDSRYLTAGANRHVVGQETIRFIGDDGEKRKETLLIYGRARERAKQHSQSSSSGSHSPSAAPSRSERPAPPPPEPGPMPSMPAMNVYGPGQTRQPASPGGRGIHWDPTPENLFSYADRLGQYNNEAIRRGEQIADSDRYQQGSYLRAFARSLPAAPRPEESNQLTLDFMKQAQKILF